MKISYKNTTAYTTKDHSEIRELLHPNNNPEVKNQSLAEANVHINQKTAEHHHRETEELYFIIQGSGIMYLDNDSFEVTQGDSIAIRPGQKHCIENTGKSELKFLCCCSPAYSHEDTYLTKETKNR